MLLSIVNQVCLGLNPYNSSALLFLFKYRQTKHNKRNPNVIHDLLSWFWLFSCFPFFYLWTQSNYLQSKRDLILFGCQRTCLKLQSRNPDRESQEHSRHLDQTNNLTIDLNTAQFFKNPKLEPSIANFFQICFCSKGEQIVFPLVFFFVILKIFLNL